MPAKTKDVSPKQTAQFYKVDMESDLKSLQQKIMSLESKLQFKHTTSRSSSDSNTKPSFDQLPGDLS